MTYEEVGTAGTLVQSVVDYSANIIFGACIDEGMSEEVAVTVIATGFPTTENSTYNSEEEKQKMQNFYINPRRQTVEQPVQPMQYMQAPQPDQQPQPVYNNAAQFGQTLYGNQNYYGQPQAQQPAQPVQPVQPAPVQDEELDAPIEDIPVNTGSKLPKFIQAIMGRKK